MQKEKISILILLISLTVLTGCKAPEKTEIEEERIVPVSVIEVKSGPYEEQRSVASEIEAWQDVTIVSQVSGEVLDIMTDIGNYVKENQLLAKIDDRIYKAQANSAKSSYQLAKDSYTRQKTLHNKKLISDQTFDSLKNQLDMASANYELAFKNLEDTMVQTPFSGVIAQKFIEKNQQVTIGTPLFRVADTSKLKIKIGVVAGDINNLKVGQKVKIKVDAIDQKEFNGKIVKLGTIADKITKQFPVEISMHSYEGVVKAGMLCDVVYTRKHHQKVFVLPRDIIEEDPYSKGVYIASGNVSVYKEIKLTTSDKDNAIITQGLEDGQLVITEGISNISNGSKISYKQGK